MDHDSNMKTVTLLYPELRDDATYYGPVNDVTDNGVTIGNCRDGVLILSMDNIADTETVKVTLQTRAGTTGDWTDVFAEKTYTGTSGTDAATYAIPVADLLKYCRIKLVASNGAASTCCATLTAWDSPRLPAS